MNIELSLKNGTFTGKCSGTVEEIERGICDLLSKRANDYNISLAEYTGNMYLAKENIFAVKDVNDFNFTVKDISDAEIKISDNDIIIKGDADRLIKLFCQVRAGDMLFDDYLLAVSAYSFF